MSDTPYVIFYEDRGHGRVAHSRLRCEWIVFCMGNAELWRFIRSGGRHMPRRVCVLHKGSVT